jgi:tetratricopeptide (TPR) repeat protein
VQTAHYLLRTDLPAAEARALAAGFEEVYAAFLDLAFRSPRPPQARIEVVLFRHEAELRRVVGGERWRGQFVRLDVDERPTVVMVGGLDAATRWVFQHELTHRFVRHHLPGAPVWLNEGLAAYHETLRLEGGRAILGEPSPCRGFFGGAGLRTGLERDGRCRVQYWVPVSRLPRVHELLEADYLAFHAPAREGAFYAGSWALVHLLTNGAEDDRRRLRVTLDALARGAGARDAFAAGFRGVDLEALDGRLRRHLMEGLGRVWQVPYRPRPAPAPEAERGLRPDEVDLLFARVRPWTAATRGAVTADLDRAVARAPGAAAAEPLYWRARARRAGGDLAGAEADLRQALALRPDEPRAVFALAALLHERARRVPPPHRALEPVAVLLERLAGLTEAAYALNLIASFHAEQGQPDRALPFAERAVQGEPGCWSCLDTLAAVRFQQGDAAAARALQQRALALAPERRVSRGMIERLRQYEAAVRGGAAPR